MAFDFEQIKQTMVSAGKEVSEKAKEASSIAKLKLDIHTKEEFLTKQYAELGKAFYQAHKNEDVPERSFFATIAEAEEELDRLNNELMDLQGAVRCPKCGSKQSDDNVFCNQCGTNLNWKNPEYKNFEEIIHGENVSEGNSQL